MIEDGRAPCTFPGSGAPSRVLVLQARRRSFICGVPALLATLGFPRGGADLRSALHRPFMRVACEATCAQHARTLLPPASLLGAGQLFGVTPWSLVTPFTFPPEQGRYLE